VSGKVPLNAPELAFDRASRRHRRSTAHSSHERGAGSASSRLSRHSPLRLCNWYVLSVAQECRQIAAGGSFGNTRPGGRVRAGLHGSGPALGLRGRLERVAVGVVT